ncbi:MAG: iron-sulfur cluster assembly scaffold protein [Nanoarchaeota archaeon]
MKKKSMYDKKIMDLWRNPKNFGELRNPTHEHSEPNTICGDEMKIHLKVENGIIKDAKFFGTGCLVCIVFASQLTEKIKKMKVEDVLKLRNEDLLKLLDIKITSLKMQCACLSLNAVQNCLKKGKIKN